MKPKDDLFLLVKSLTKTEKGYFKKYAQMHGGNTDGNYLKLFNLLEGMEQYDEAELKETLKGDKLLKHFSVSKNYLFKFLLRALSSFHRDNIPELQLYHLLAEERVLRARRLPVNQDFQVKKVESIIQQFGENQFQPLLQWVKHDRNIRTAFEDFSEEEYAQWRNDFLLAGDNQWQEMQIAVLYMDVLRSRGNYAEYVKMLREAVKHPLLQQEPVHLSIKARVSYWGMWHRYHRTQNDIPSYIAANMSLVDMIERQPAEFKDKYTHLLINTLAEIWSLRSNQGDKEEAVKLGERFKAIDVSNHIGLDRLKKRCELENEQIFIRQFGKRGDYKAFNESVKDVLDEIYNREIPLNQGAIRFMLGVGLMMDNEPSDALDYFNWLLNDKTFSSFPYYPFCWFWSILAHYEIGNRSLIPSLISSTTNNLKKRLATHPLEKDLLKELKNLAAKNSTDEAPVFGALYQMVKEHMPTYNAIDQKGYAEILEWLGRKNRALVATPDKA